MQTWVEAIGAEKQKEYFIQLLDKVHHARQLGTIYPAAKDVFNAFRYTNFAEVKVVILGQDPYHGPNQAHGLAFSVQEGVDIPPSLKNIYKELSRDISGFKIPLHGYLKKWADQGVLLLNTVLTVQAGLAHSHASWGWERFTDKVIQVLNEEREGVVFLLWGSHAQKKGALIDRQKHLVLTSAHPSPLSAHRGFLGNHHFSQTNAYLVNRGETPINWQV
ncbi:uracil-DNA glycosylase [Pelistega sp. MC2]|uniref:uracil-DNA glycosylase n=1 Tax=Pelistega sp. MC2 TaxID=1720297 RepID=UPI0008D930AA|nr:uracil-DNA glycosylase [Pelistega sp. MC2]